MINFSFQLNDQSISALKSGSFTCPAFSGARGHINRRSSMCIVDVGPIPVGTYYVVNRKSNGMFGAIRDYASGKDEWFALYAADNRIDDETFCENVKRGNFRLHPKGPLGISKGCITVEKQADFDRLRTLLLKTSTIAIPNSTETAYGRIVVV